MTKPVTSKHQRLLAIERRLAKIESLLPEAVKLRVDNALLASTVTRLIGENDALKRNVAALEGHIQNLMARPKVAA